MLNGKLKLKGVHSDLVIVIGKAAEACPFDLLVTEGVRTKERQEQLYAQGRTAPGKIVTWTLNSKHIEGKAIDVVPLIDNKIPWNDGLLFITMGKIVLKAAQDLNIPIRWGYDWDRDGVVREKGEHDGPHFELL